MGEVKCAGLIMRDRDSNNSLSKNEYRIKWGICFVLRLIFVSFRIEISKE